MMKLVYIFALLFISGVASRPTPDEGFSGRKLEQYTAGPVADQPCITYGDNAVYCNDVSTILDGCDYHWTGCFYSSALQARVPNYIGGYWCGPTCDNSGFDPATHTLNSIQCPAIACATSFAQTVTTKTGCSQVQAYLKSRAQGVAIAASQTNDLVPLLLQVATPNFCLSYNPITAVEAVAGAWALTLADAFAEATLEYGAYLCSSTCLGQGSTINTCLQQGAACQVGVSGFVSAWAQATANNAALGFSQIMSDPFCGPYALNVAAQASSLASAIASQLQQAFVQQSAVIINGKSALCIGETKTIVAAAYAQAITCSIVTAFAKIFTQIQYNPATGNPTGHNTTLMAEACAHAYAFTYGGSAAPGNTASTLAQFTCSSTCTCPNGYYFAPATNGNSLCCPNTQVWDKNLGCECPAAKIWNDAAWACQ